MNMSEWIRRLFTRDRSSSAAIAQPRQVSNLTRKTTIASQLEVADHGESRRKGLLGRTALPQGGGLWIQPCEAVHTIGMQFPIDLIYLDRKYVIKKTRSNVGPWRISACLSAHSVIELPSGTIRATQTERGDQLEFGATSFSFR